MCHRAIFHPCWSYGCWDTGLVVTFWNDPPRVLVGLCSCAIQSLSILLFLFKIVYSRTQNGFIWGEFDPLSGDWC